MVHEISIDSDGIIIDGKPKILLCSSLFYFRIPKESWQDRIEKLKLCGYNCIDVYIPWNYHELSPGIWDFSGQRNVDEFFHLASKMGLYVIARPGPYICSEWDGGGLPAFLNTDGLRTNNRNYLDQLERWMNKILPIVAKHQITSNGSVVMLQLENEMDYFTSNNPKEYIDCLVDLSKVRGIEIPLISCAGQWHVEAATGYSEDVSIAYNVYMDERESLFEDRCIKIQKELYKKDLPFLIMETHRPHNLLKRELCCGARLISPYNQTAGVNYDLYNGISNWGATNEGKHFPLAYMATDYDFEATMISGEGILRKEVLGARLLSNLIQTFPSIANGQPTVMENVLIGSDLKFPQSVDEDGKKTNVTFGYKFDGGTLINITNLSEHKGFASVSIGNDTLNLDLDPLETKLLPYDISLENFGIQGTLLWSEAEIAWISANNESCEIVLFSTSRASLCLETFESIRHDKANVSVDKKDNRYILSGHNCTNTLFIGNKLLKIVICSPVEASKMRSPWLKALDNFNRELVSKDMPILGAAEIDLPTPVMIGPLKNLEEYGVYRGGGIYEIDIQKDQKLLLHNVSDIIYIYHEGELVDISHKSGTTFSLDVSPGNWTFITEGWGHSNFNDVRLPSLRMGSKKGIYAITAMEYEEDITDLFHMQFDQFPFGKVYHQSQDKIPTIVSVNEIARSETPLCLSFSRNVYPPKDHDRFVLCFKGNEAYTAVYIDGIFLKVVDPADPFIDISNAINPGHSFRLTLRVMKANCYQPVGHINFICGKAINECKFVPMDLSYYLSLAQTESAKGYYDYPIKTYPGSFMVVKIGIPHMDNDARIIFDGSDAELFCILNDHVVGRILLPTKDFPQVKGGDPHSFTIPKEWTGGEPLTILICGIGAKPELRSARISSQ